MENRVRTVWITVVWVELAPRSALITAVSLSPAGMAATSEVARSSSVTADSSFPMQRVYIPMQKNISSPAPSVRFSSYRSPRDTRCPMKAPAMAWSTVFRTAGKAPMPVKILKPALNAMAPISAPAGIFIL